ncbi:diacylglycerol/lipid kinase family protein [Rossellomorea aquimaris]|uniref:diacylglycerol/lipid kinase family protein n=1 Tax=Rossellomorea aquimaris TaxID=189382 RepID=UPI0007D07F95|nr:diacylglycerol kinase family protein [Rossellomorea aquimaris]
MKTIFIVNPSARNNHALSSWKRFNKQLDPTHSIFLTEKPTDVRRIVSDLVKQFPNEPLHIIGVGGDGTMNSVISGTIGFENIVIGYIPSGSGNDFARGYNWPNSKKEAYTLIRNWTSFEDTLSLDSGQFAIKEGPKGYFVNNIGIGFDAHIAQKANESQLKKWLNKWSLGKLIYPIILCKETLRFKPFSLSLTVNGKEKRFDKVWFVTISNQPYFGGGMKISPHASPIDGKLDITIVHDLSKWKLLLLFISVFFGKHTSFKEVNTYKGENVKIQCCRQVPVHVDGDSICEIVLENILQVNVLPSSWKMLKQK